MPYKLEPKTHTIYIDAPSVTEIADMVYPFKAGEVPPKFLKMGQERGTCVHKQIEMYIKFGSKIGCTCKKKVKTHIEQGKWIIKWWDDFLKEHLNGNKEYKAENEVIMYRKDFNFCWELTGIADCILTIFDRDSGKIVIFLIDWKTTKDKHPEKEAVQLWCYGELYNRDDIDHYIIVNSNKKTSYELTPEQMEQGKQDALKGLQLYKEKRDKEIWN